jgi:hypothetical protein
VCKPARTSMPSNCTASTPNSALPPACSSPKRQPAAYAQRANDDRPA